MPYDDDSGIITATMLAAAEQQRQTDQAVWDAQTQARDLARQTESLNQQLQREAERTLDIESDYYQLFNLLKAPMHVIAQRNAYFAQTYAAAQREIAMLKTSELAFRELAIQLGSKVGMSPQAVTGKAARMQPEVLRNAFPKEHGTNAATSRLLQEYGPAILADFEVEQKAFRDTYSELINGRIFNLLDGEVDGWTQFFDRTRQLANAGNIKAQYNLGFCFYYGHGAARNYDLAQKWLLEAHHGDVEAATLLLHFFYSDSDNPQYNASTADQYLQLAERRGNKRAIARRPEWDVKRKKDVWNREEATLLQKLLTVRPGHRPPELDQIRGRGYLWENLATLVHSCEFHFVRGDTQNLGTLFRPKRNTHCYIDVVNPTDISEKIWFELEHDSGRHGFRPLEWNGNSELIKPNGKTRVDIGKYHAGTVSTGITIRSQQKERFGPLARLEHICSGLKYGTLSFVMETDASHTV